MSEKKKWRETCIMINDISQHSVAIDLVWWEFWPLLYYKFTAESALNEFLKALNTWQSHDKKTDFLKCAMCRGTLSCRKMNNSLQIWHMTGSNCLNSITLRLILFINLDSVTDECQAGVMLTNCNLPTDDWCYQYLNVMLHSIELVITRW